MSETYDGKEAVRRILDGKKVRRSTWDQAYLWLSNGSIVGGLGLEQILPHDDWQDYIEPAQKYRMRYDVDIKGDGVGHVALVLGYGADIKVSRVPRCFFEVDE